MKMLVAAWLSGALVGLAFAICGAYYLVKSDEKPDDVIQRNTAQRSWWS